MVLASFDRFSTSTSRALTTRYTKHSACADFATSSSEPLAETCCLLYSATAGPSSNPVNAETPRSEPRDKDKDICRYHQNFLKRRSKCDNKDMMARPIELERSMVFDRPSCPFTNPSAFSNLVAIKACRDDHAFYPYTIHCHSCWAGRVCAAGAIADHLSSSTHSDGN